MAVGTSDGKYFENSFDYTLDSYQSFSRSPQARIDESFEVVNEAILAGEIDPQGANNMPPGANRKVAGALFSEGGRVGKGEILSDASPDPIIAGQKYAAEAPRDNVTAFPGQRVKQSELSGGGGKSGGGSPKAANDNIKEKYTSPAHQEMIRLGGDPNVVSRLSPDRVKYINAFTKQQINKKFGEGAYERTNEIAKVREEFDRVIAKIHKDFPDYPKPVSGPAPGSLPLEKAITYGLSATTIAAATAAGWMQYKGMLDPDNKYPLTEEGWNKWKEDFFSISKPKK